MRLSFALRSRDFEFHPEGDVASFLLVDIHLTRGGLFQGQSATVKDCLDRVPIAAVLVNERGFVRYANRAAQTISRGTMASQWIARAA